jgi:hypothetical protein
MLMLKATRFALRKFFFSFFSLFCAQSTNKEILPPAAGLSKWCSNPVIANVGMPTIQSVSRMASRKYFVGKQRIPVFAQSLRTIK